MSRPIKTAATPWWARFNEAWRRWQVGGSPPDWSHYLPNAAEPIEPEHLVYLLHTDIEFRVKAGFGTLLGEGYFRHPALAALSVEQRVELIRWEYQQRWKRGQRTPRDEYRAAFPELADELADLR